MLPSRTITSAFNVYLACVERRLVLRDGYELLQFIHMVTPVTATVLESNSTKTLTYWYSTMELVSGFSLYEALPEVIYFHLANSRTSPQLVLIYAK